jgi:hypothetical protein
MNSRVEYFLDFVTSERRRDSFLLFTQESRPSVLHYESVIGVLKLDHRASSSKMCQIDV